MSTATGRDRTTTAHGLPSDSGKFVGAVAATAFAAAIAGFIIALLFVQVLPAGITPRRAAASAGLGTITVAAAVWLMCALSALQLLPLPIRFARWISTLVLIRIIVEHVLDGLAGVSSAAIAGAVGTLCIVLITRTAQLTVGREQ